MMARELTKKQQSFVDNYLESQNATQADIDAGYKTGKNADKIGYQQLEKTRVQKAIQKAQKKRSDKLEIDAEYVLRRHHEIDNMVIVDILDQNNNVKPIHAWS